MNIIHHPSPNFNDRPTDCPVDMLIMHYTGMKTGDEALERMCDPKVEVSAHYMVEEDGTIYQLVSEDKRAWHAGVSFWRGQTNINDRSIGIEIVNPGHEFGYTPFPDAQIQSVLSLSQTILKRHPIPARNVIGHSDIAPTRKQDPGELFPWMYFAQNGVGLWPCEQKRETTLKEWGFHENDNSDNIMAFQRHFLPDHLSGKMDEKTKKTLNRLGPLLTEPPE